MVRQEIYSALHDLRRAINQLSAMNSESIRSTNEALLSWAPLTGAILHVAFGLGLAGTAVFLVLISRRIVRRAIAGQIERPFVDHGEGFLG